MKNDTMNDTNSLSIAIKDELQGKYRNKNFSNIKIVI